MSFCHEYDQFYSYNGDILNDHYFHQIDQGFDQIFHGIKILESSKYHLKDINEYITTQTEHQFYFKNKELKPKFDSKQMEIEEEQIMDYKTSENLEQQENKILQQLLKQEKSLLKIPIEQLLEQIQQEETNKTKEQQVQQTDKPINSKLLIDEYMPEYYDQLLSDEKTNREALTWLKAWENKVYKKKKKIYYNQQIQQNFNGFVSNKKTFVNYGNYQQVEQMTQEQLTNTVLLLSGQAGCGKTTLCRVISQLCKFNCVEINSSEERNAKKLKQKIQELITCNDAKNNKPNLVILDEVDGLQDQNESGALKELLDYIFKPGKEQKLNISRPIIFICNDPYAKGMQQLRNNAIWLRFRKVHQDVLMERLNQICYYEKINIDQENLLQIVNQNDCDIRGSLMQLQMYSKIGKKSLTQNSFNDQRQINLNIVTQLEQVFFNHENTFNIQKYAFEVIMKNADPDKVFDALFNNYNKLKYLDKFPTNINKFSDILQFSDLLCKNSFKYQNQTNQFIGLFAIKIGSKAKHNQIHFKLDHVTYKKNYDKKKFVNDTINQIRPKIAEYQVFFKVKSFISDMLSSLYQLIQPNLNDAILSENDKKMLQASLSIMVDYNIQPSVNEYPIYLEDKSTFEPIFKPLIERLLIFGNQQPLQRVNKKSIEFLKQYYDIIKFKKNQMDINDDEIVIQNHKNKYEKQTAKKKQFQDITYKYYEGTNIPIIYNLKMGFFRN